MRVRIRQVVLMLIQTALATTALLSPDAASALTISSITRSSSPFPTDECGVAVSQDARALVVLGLGHDNAFWMLCQDGGARALLEEGNLTELRHGATPHAHAGEVRQHKG